MYSKAGVAVVSSSWQACVLVFPGLFLSILTNFLSSEGDALALLADFGKVVTILIKLYICLN